MSEMLGVISDTERLANDLSSVDLISYQVKMMSLLHPSLVIKKPVNY